MFHAKAVVLATGGIGRAYKINSNSWEGTGDGHSLAYHAGAELIDMEFIQFHPTGMVWPPSVRGILVTEGVRGEGGVLRNKEGRRFMFDDIPDNYAIRRRTTKKKAGATRRATRTPRRPAGAADARSRGPLHHARSQGRPRAARTAECSWIFPGSRRSSRTPPSTSEKAAEHVSSVQAVGRHRHHRRPDGGRPDHPLHHGRHARGQRLADVQHARAVRRG